MMPCAVDGDQAVDDGIQDSGDQAAQSGLARLDHGFGGGALGDVAGDLAEAMQRAVGRTDGGDHHVGEETRAVFADAFADGLEATGVGGDLEFALWPAGGDILRRVEAREVAADDFVGTITLDQLRSAVPRQDATVRIEQQQRVVVHARRSNDGHSRSGSGQATVAG